MKTNRTCVSRMVTNIMMVMSACFFLVVVLQDCVAGFSLTHRSTNARWVVQQQQRSVLQRRSKPPHTTGSSSCILKLTELLSKGRRKNDGSFSYVEGDEFENELMEIDALGGDPAFLSYDDTDEADEDNFSESEPEWDGTVDEDAHFD